MFVCLFFVCLFWAIPSDSLGLLLSVHSGITCSCDWGTIGDAGLNFRQPCARPALCCHSSPSLGHVYCSASVCFIHLLLVGRASLCQSLLLYPLENCSNYLWAGSLFGLKSSIYLALEDFFTWLRDDMWVCLAQYCRCFGPYTF